MAAVVPESVIGVPLPACAGVATPVSVNVSLFHSPGADHQQAFGAVTAAEAGAASAMVAAMAASTARVDLTMPPVR